MKHFRLDIDNYGDQALDDNPIEETARILREVADRLEMGNESGTLYDYNGNAVGSWALMGNED
jgi:hypothetical protein